MAEIYRERAADCLRLAVRADTITSKLLWLDMSYHWLSLASHAEETRAKGPERLPRGLRAGHELS
jgi:hypothetical protein